MAIKDHLADIDFRTREERQETYKEEFIQWYKTLANHNLNQPFDERLFGQQNMLGCVLWYLLPKKEYDKLTKLK